MNEKKRVKRQDDPGGGNWTDTTDDDNQPVLSLSLPLALCPFGYLPHPRAEMASTALGIRGHSKKGKMATWRVWKGKKWRIQSFPIGDRRPILRNWVQIDDFTFSVIRVVAFHHQTPLSPTHPS